MTTQYEKDVKDEKLSLRERIDVIMWINSELQKADPTSQKATLAYNTLCVQGPDMVEIIQALVELLGKAIEFIEHDLPFMPNGRDYDSNRDLDWLERREQALKAISLEVTEDD